MALSKMIREAARMAADAGKKQMIEQADKAQRIESLKNFNRLSGEDVEEMGLKKGGKVSSASKRADGCVKRGKTKGRFV